MAWIELLDKRQRRNKTWIDDSSGRRKLHARMSPLHYEQVIDSGVYDTEVNLTPQRINNSSFDGWRTQVADWHYSLGQPAGKADGWVGFGGRQGQHWFGFRLLRVGYLHWPSRSWDDIGGAPTYNRVNLTNTPKTVEVGPNNQPVTIQSNVEWRNIWTTPGGGELFVHWKVNGERLKEYITINEVARSWIAANHPPSTTLSETFFGFVFQLDWSDIPRIYRAGLLKGVSEDFADDGEPIELRDALDRLLAFMPLDYLVVGEQQIPLRKRFYQDGTNSYLLVGVRCDELVGLPVGDLVFDPSISQEAVGESADDAWQDSGGSANLTITAATWGTGDSAGTPHRAVGLRFQSIPLDGTYTIDSAIIQAEKNGAHWNTIGGTWYGENVDDAAKFSPNKDITSRDYTTASVACAENLNRADGTYYSLPSDGDWKTIVQEIVDRPGWSSGNDMAFIFDGDYASSWAAADFSFWDHATAGEPLFDVDYTSGATSSIPSMIRYYRNRRA